MQQLKEISTHQRKKTNEMLASLLQDLNEIGQAIGSPIVENIKLGEKVEEEFTAARLMVAKAKAEVKNLVHRCQTLETSQMDCNKKAWINISLLYFCRASTITNHYSLMSHVILHFRWMSMKSHWANAG